jgi:alcohol dehydrogenase (NADP+)
MSTDYKFEGWMGEDERSAEGNMVWRDYEPKKWEETDIDIRITHCGVCGSDIHVLRSGWVSKEDTRHLRQTSLT